MKNLCFLFVFLVFLFYSCSKDDEPKPITLIEQIGQYLTSIGYEVTIIDEGRLQAKGYDTEEEFLKAINKFYEEKGYPDVFNVDTLFPINARIERLRCVSGPLYWSGRAICQNFACFRKGKLVDFSTTCIKSIKI